MAKSKRRKAEKAKRKKRRSMLGGGDSNYARKRAYCVKNQTWGFEVPYPKPWKAKAGKQ